MAVALFGLLCLATGFTAGIIACWVGGMFAVGTRADENTDYPEREEWDFPPFGDRVYDQDNDAA